MLASNTACPASKGSSRFPGRSTPITVPGSVDEFHINLSRLSNTAHVRFHSPAFSEARSPILNAGFQEPSKTAHSSMSHSLRNRSFLYLRSQPRFTCYLQMSRQEHLTITAILTSSALHPKKSVLGKKVVIFFYV